MSKLTEQLLAFAGGEQDSLLLPDGTVNMEARGRAPTEAELQNECAAPGEDALLPIGINYTCNWKVAADGMGKHSRQQVKALALSGLAVRLSSLYEPYLFSDALPPEVQEVAYLEGITFGATLFSIKHLVLETGEKLRRLVCPPSANLTEELEEQVYRNTVVYTSWERDTVSPDLVAVLRRVGQVWVPCEANARVFREAGLVRVHVVPYPFDPGTCTLAAPRGREDLVPEGRRFYNIGKWEPRKNQHRLIGGFLLAHSPKDRASLLIKTSAFGRCANYPTPAESVDFWLSEPDVVARGWTRESLDTRLRIIDEKVSEEELLRLHEKSNIYVSAACGEAWDIPAFDAKCAGNALVYVGFGGPEDYAEPSDVRVRSEMGPVHPGYRWEPNARWAHATAEDLARAMKEVQVKPRRMLPPELVVKYSQFAVAKRMEQLLHRLAQDNGCEEAFFMAKGFG